MGVRDLWPAISSASQMKSFTKLAIMEGFEMKHRLERCLRIGIDSSIWMNQAQEVLTSNWRRPGTRAGENPAIRTLFYSLCHLLTLPVVPIFVFDGPDRLSVKRGTAVKVNKPHWLTLPFQAFIEAFGFHWYTAPGKAEAELAELNQRDHIDIVISGDVDALVFGARFVIRKLNLKGEGDRVAFFDADIISSNSEVRLSRAGLFFMAILCAGDYDTVGLKGCGWKTARVLAQSTLAHSLFTAASTSSRNALNKFLVDWRRDFRTLLMHDPQNELGKNYPSLAKHVTTNFPSVDILLLYAQPLTSWTHGQSMPHISSWQLRQPDVTKITTLSEKYFSWGSSGVIVSRFKNTLWPGIAIRHLLRVPDLDVQLASCFCNSSPLAGSFQTSSVLRIHKTQLGPGTPACNPIVPGFVVEVLTHGILSDMALGLDAGSCKLDSSSDCPKIMFWIPAVVLKAALPGLIKLFYQNKKSAKPRTFPDYVAVLRPLTDPSSPIAPAEHRGGEEFIEGSSTGIECRDGHQFLGYLNLCTPSPSP